MLAETPYSLLALHRRHDRSKLPPGLHRRRLTQDRCLADFAAIALMQGIKETRFRSGSRIGNFDEFYHERKYPQKKRQWHLLHGRNDSREDDDDVEFASDAAGETPAI